MTDETITFEMIRKIQREEVRVSKLTKLPEGFYKNINSYLQQKKMIVKSTGSGATELKSIEILIEDIFNRRERKILNMVLIAVRTKIPPENLTEEEKVFFEKMVDVVRERRKEGLAALMEEQEIVAEDAVKMMAVVFKNNVEEFVGSDLKNYGPFKKGDGAEIPEDNAKLLLEKELTEEA